jgi:hypothetical protein
MGQENDRSLCGLVVASLDRRQCTSQLAGRGQEYLEVSEGLPQIFSEAPLEAHWE